MWRAMIREFTDKVSVMVSRGGRARAAVAGICSKGLRHRYRRVQRDAAFSTTWINQDYRPQPAGSAGGP